jgi:hypothetical protein
MFRPPPSPSQLSFKIQTNVLLIATSSPFSLACQSIMTVGGKKKGRHMSQLEDGVAQSAIEAPPSAGGLVAPAPPTLDLDFTIESVRIPQSLAGTIGDRVVGYNSFSQFSQTFFSPTVNDPSYR